ncbi:hypothetical protein Dimus_022126, partial [Dionaea muscipula]
HSNICQVREKLPIKLSPSAIQPASSLPSTCFAYWKNLLMYISVKLCDVRPVEKEFTFEKFPWRSMFKINNIIEGDTKSASSSFSMKPTRSYFSTFAYGSKKQEPHIRLIVHHVCHGKAICLQFIAI